RLRLRRGLILQLRLLTQQIECPGRGVGRGLVSGKVEGRRIVHRKLERLVFRKALHQRADHIGDEILRSPGRKPFAHQLAERVAASDEAAIAWPTRANAGTSASTAGGVKLAATIFRCARHSSPSELKSPRPIVGARMRFTSRGFS